MKVLKFGGTSVGTVNSLQSVKKIVEERTEPVIVVVSALGGITDILINTANKAAEADLSYLEGFEEVCRRHKVVIEGMVPQEKQAEVQTRVTELLDELSNIYKGVSLIRDLSNRTLDLIVSYGERMSSFIISHIIKDAILKNSLEFIKTVDQYEKHVLDTDTALRLVHETFDNLEYKVVIVPGFIASDAKGVITNLGRGGSDYTAAILAAALDADTLEIWTDVDGFMSADPRKIKDPHVIDNLSFIEAMELCNFGAKVIYPPTIYPVFHKNIPIYIKNTFNPEARGTRISDDPMRDTDRDIKGISSINDTCLITISGLCMVGVIGVNARIFNALARNGVSVFLVSQASSENTTSFAVKNDDAKRAVAALQDEFAAELETGEMNPINVKHDLATVAIVGENMRNDAGIAGRLFNTLGRNGINVIAFAQGASETNISFVVDLKDQNKALSVIHDSFFLSDTQVLNLFIIGIGNIGCHLLQQLASQHDSLLSQKALELKVMGIANSKKMIFDRNGIDIATYHERLNNEGVESTPEGIRDTIIAMNMYNSVLVDCTANPEIAEIYLPLLSKNVNVVTANKIAASGDYELYRTLKSTARKKDAKFLFETNVGAGLPIINTINNLINSGDSIIKIEAVISGSLNYIFNTISEETPLSEAIGRAVEEKYCEPDPRIDLCGGDVLRKIVILAREAGYKISAEDVDLQLFLPKEFFEGTIDEFYSKVHNFDSEFSKKLLHARESDGKLRFIASFEAPDKARIALSVVDSRHPFYRLEGSTNVILLTTDRYKEYPMEIKGYGAGAEVTAAGVFADIIGIANIR